MNELKVLIWSLIWIFLGGILALNIMCWIFVRMKNKTKKYKKQQVICQKQKKTFNARNFISNYDEFIAENTKGMSLYEIKEFVKNVDLEIYSLVMKGVR